MVSAPTYKYSAYSIYASFFAALLLCVFYTWQNPGAVNFMGGDARYYYYYLQSTFIDPALVSYDWLADPTPLTHHPVGLCLLLLPFFLPALGIAKIFHFPLTGLSLPFQASVSLAALTYCFIGLVYLKKLFRLNHISDKVTALVIPLLFFGTTLLHYTLTESGMSHAYSFCLITAFLYYSCRFVNEGGNRHLLCMAALLGLILLVRANNGLVVFTLFFWFKSREQVLAFFRSLLRNPYFYLSVVVVLAMVSLQVLTWYWKENVLFSNRYAPYGFYWTRPALAEMLFGFNAGFFIYAPLCFLFMLGLITTYKNKFLFFGMLGFLLAVFYFFSAYSAYTYFDGLGIRVLVDYYALFALLGAKLFSRFELQPLAYGGIASLALVLLVINIIYCYQGSTDILARSGMTYSKWKYVFLKTGSEYRGCLGGSNDLVPFANPHPAPSLQADAGLQAPFDYSQKDFGLALSFDSLGFNSNRIFLKIDIDRREKSVNSSSDVLVCAMLEDKTNTKKGYAQFRLNETPSTTCCDNRAYHYGTNMEGNFKPDDHLSVYLWNIKQQEFLVNKFSVSVYNYNYQTN